MRVCNIWLLEVLCILSTIMIVNTSVNTSRKPTVKITTQSSIFNAALPSGKVVDGCTQQNFSQKCCSHTQIGQQEAWWQVDLEGPIVMEYVKIYYREPDGSNKQRQRFGGYQIYQSNTSDWRIGYRCHKDITATPAALLLTPKIPCTGNAQYLTIYSDRRSGGLEWYSKNAILELCEVEVYGCPLGKYGDGNCDSECDAGCVNDLCDPVTGKCAYCEDRFFGSSCDDCSAGCTNRVCDKISGYCSPCFNGFYGVKCDRLCFSNCENNTCTQNEGKCTACKPGYFGDICNTSCPSNCKGDICHQTSGLCTDCKDGFFGKFCDVCSVGCTNHVCDKVSGYCSPCRLGYFGGTCNTSCPSNCKGDTCNQTSGLCTACKPRYYGDTCTISCPSNCKGNTCNQTSGLCTVCVAGFYGSKCLKSCGNCQGVSCDKGYGDCTTGCTDGWTGNKCDNKVVIITNGDSAVGIGIGSGVVILALVIVIIVLVRRLTMKRSDITGPSHMTDISLSKTAKELKQQQDNTYDEIATYNKEQTIAQISHNEATYEQLGRREVEIPHIYETTDVDKKT